MTPKEIAELIKECYDLLPKSDIYHQEAKANEVAFRTEKLKIASECVFSGLGINRITGERT